MSSTDRLAIVGRSTADDRATFGLYYDERISKKSTDCRPIIGRPLPDAAPMTKPCKNVARFSHFWLTDPRATVGLGNVTVVLWPGHIFPVCLHCDLGDMTLEQGSTDPLVMKCNYVKLYPDRTMEYEVMARTRCEQTGKQTDRQTNKQSDG